MSIAVVSAIFGRYDKVKEPLGDHTGVDFYLFSDLPLESKRWTVIEEPLYKNSDRPNTLNQVNSTQDRVANMMKAKFFKAQAFRLNRLPTKGVVVDLGQYEYIMWVDGAFQVKDVNLVELCREYLQSSPIALFEHSVRNNIVDEVYYCANNTIDYLRERYHDQNMYHQCLHYIRDGFDIHHSGLQELGNFVYRPKSKVVQEVLDLWWEENQRYTYQDQISMPYCLWKKNVMPTFISDNVYDNPFAKHFYHAKTEKKRQSQPTSLLSRSLDCFDTIVVRAHPDPAVVFQKVGRALNIPDFVVARKKAERDGAGLAQIYQNLKSDGVGCGVRMELVETYEYFLEMSQMTLNTDILRHYASNSIIVSDMYWPEEKIRYLMNLVGLNPTHIFVTTNGKATGNIWPRVFEAIPRNKIHSHVGDNHHSDVAVASKFLTATHYTATNPTLLERKLSDSGSSHLAGLCRTMRLSNPFSRQEKNRDIWQFYTKHWLPISYLLAARIQERLHELKANKILFLSRDMFIVYRIFKLLYPNITATYVCFSRHAATKGDPLFVNHFRNMCTPNTIVLDMLGTGKTFDTFQRVHNIPFRAFITCFTHVAERPPKCEYLHLTSSGAENIERMNYSVHGSFVGFDKTVDNIVVLPLEYTPKLVDLYLNIVYLSFDRLKLVLDDLRSEDTLGDFHGLMNSLLEFQPAEERLVSNIGHEGFHDPKTIVNITRDQFEQLCERSDGSVNGVVAEFKFDDGNPPVDNSDILAWIFPVFFVMMLIAAIVIVSFRPRYGSQTPSSGPSIGTGAFFATGSTIS